jgi:hypothetical protein
MPDFDDAMLLIRLAADPAAFKARIEELRTATAAMDEATAESQVALQNLDAERHRLATLETAIRAREVAVKSDELRHAGDLAEIEAFRREQRSSRLESVGAGLTRDRDADEPAQPSRFTLADPNPHEVANPTATNTRRSRGHTFPLRTNHH